LARAPRRRRANRTPARWIIAFCLPALLLYGLLIVTPLGTAFYYGFFRWEGIQRAEFAGIGNYQEVLTRYPLGDEIPVALWHNILFFAGTMAVQNTIGLGLALLLYRNPRFKRFFQTVFSLPYLISPLIVGYIWSLMLSPTFGPINYMLGSIGLESWTRPWLGDPDTALPVLILVNAWQWIGGPMLIFLAALGSIPQEYEEAASIDGASAPRTFWSIRLPLLMPAVGVITVLTFIGTFNIFDLVYALGGSDGGPGGAMDVLGLLYYRTAFEGGVNAIGESSALAILIFVIVFGIALVLERFLRRREVAT
jgi:raffinose/stachyose/melibiose transport system permease protein